MGIQFFLNHSKFRSELEQNTISNKSHDQINLKNMKSFIIYCNICYWNLEAQLPIKISSMNFLMQRKSVTVQIGSFSKPIYRLLYIVNSASIRVLPIYSRQTITSYYSNQSKQGTSWFFFYL